MELRNKEGKPTIPSIPTKDVLLKEIAKKIPTLPGRAIRLAQIRARQAEYEARVAASTKPGKKEEKKKAAASSGKKRR